MTEWKGLVKTEPGAQMVTGDDDFSVGQRHYIAFLSDSGGVRHEAARVLTHTPPATYNFRYLSYNV